VERTMTVDQAIEDNKYSRVYLGVHFHIDCSEGSALGEDVAKKVSSAI
jgi:hypothetical protein